MGIITSSVAGAMIVSLRSQTSSAASLAESHDQQRLALWLPRDVESAVFGSIDTTSGAAITGAAPLCSGTPTPVGSTNALKLLSVDVSSGTTVRYFTSYRVEGAAPGPYLLVRYSCREAQPVGRQVMVENMPTTTSVTVAQSSSSVQMTVTTLQSGSGLQFTISGTPRTRGVGAVGGGSNACLFASGVLTPFSVGLTGGDLSQAVGVTVTTTGVCTNLSLRFLTGDLTPAHTIPLFGGPNAWTATIPASDPGYTWTSGSKSIAILGTTNSGSLQLAVGTTCAVASGNASPTQSGLNGPAPATLAASLTVSVSTTGPCTALSLSFNTGVGAQTVALTGGPTNWAATIPAALTWTVGPHPFTVTGATGGTVPFTVIGPCTYVSAAATPNTVVRGAGGTLSLAVSLAVTTVGSCGGVTLDVRTGANPSTDRTVIMAETAPGSGSWTAVINPTTYTTWTLGLKTFKVLLDGTLTANTFTLDVQPGCVMTSGAGAPDPSTMALNGTLTAAVQFTVITTGPCSNLKLSVPISGALVQTLTLVQSPANTWKVTAAANASNAWASGTKTVTVLGTANNDTFPFNVNDPPCNYSAGSVTPGSVQMNGVNTLSAGFTISFTTTGVCTGLTATIATGGANQTVTFAESPAGTWSTTVAANAFTTWTPGTHAITLNGTANGGTLSVATVQACTFVNAAMTVNPLVLVSYGSTLSAPVTFTITTAGNCPAGSVTATLPTGNAQTPNNQTVTFAGGPTSWTFTVAAAAYSTWTTGTKTMTVNTTVGGTITFDVINPPCTFGAGSGGVTPTSITLAGAAPSTLATGFTIAFTTTGVCSGLNGTIATSPTTNQTITFTETPVQSGNWSATVGASAFNTWNVGTHNITVNGTSNGGTLSVATVQACTFVSGSATPGTVNLVAYGTTLAGQLKLDVITAGNCPSAPSITFPTGSAATPNNQTITLSGTAPNWTTTILPTAFSTWAIGTKPVTVNTTVAGSFTFIVQNPPCVYSAGSVTPGSLILAGASPNALSGSFVTAFTTTGVCSGLTGTIATSGTTNGTITFTESPVQSGNWSATVASTAFNTWNIGTHAITVNGTSNGGTLSITTLQACTFVSGSVVANPVLSGTNLSAPLVLNVTTSGNCAGPTIPATVQTGTAGVPNNQPVNLTGSGTAWTVTIGATAYNTWTGGSKTVTVTTAVGGTFTFTVLLPCTISTPSNSTNWYSPSPIVHSNAQQTINFTLNTTGTCTGVSFPNPGTGTPTVSLTETAPGSGVWTGSSKDKYATVNPALPVTITAAGPGTTTTTRTIVVI
jgi:hypothetical protein